MTLFKVLKNRAPQTHAAKTQRTLSQFFSAKLFTAALILLSSVSQAVVMPRDGVRDSSGGNNYGPVMPYPQDPHYGDNRGSVTSEEIYVGRYVRNESIDLLREVGHLRGYRIRSVQVQIQRAREVNSTVDLMANGRSEDSRRAEVNRAVVLSPRSILEIGRRLDRLEVYARGEMLIDRIVVELASEVSNPPPYQNGPEIAVRLNLPSYWPPQPRLDLTPYVDIRRYRGYTVRAVQITGYAVRLRADLDVQLNSFSEGRMLLDPRQSTQTIRSRQNLVIGSSFGSLVLVPRGDAQILDVTLILSRY